MSASSRLLHCENCVNARPGTASAQSSPSFQMSPSERRGAARPAVHVEIPASFCDFQAIPVLLGGYADRMLVETLCISMRRFRGTSMKAWRCDFDKHGVGRDTQLRWVSRAEFARGCRFYGCPADAIWTACHQSGGTKTYPCRGAGMKFWEFGSRRLPSLGLALMGEVLWIRTGFDLRQTWVSAPENPQPSTMLLQNVAKQMQRVFKLMAAEKRGDLKDSDRQVLTRSFGGGDWRILSHLAQFSRELWGTGHSETRPKKGHGFANKWTTPLVGMNVEHLKDLVLQRDWQILCIPGLPQGRHQDWLARLSVTTELCPKANEADEAENFLLTDVHTYRYLRESFTWTLDDDCQFDQETC
eukprot:Skav210891  [mRNA]  locus=scaffold1060:16805:29276:- [translate_table: standard]